MDKNDSSHLDVALRLFVKVMSEIGAQLGLSVLVGGSWVCGTLISPRMWTEELSLTITRLTRSNGEGVETFFKEMGRLYFPGESEQEVSNHSDGSDDEDLPRFIHLRGARVWTAGVATPDSWEHSYLRLAIGSVEGWTVGELGLPSLIPKPNN